MGCCPNGIFQPLIIDCSGTIRALQANESLLVNNQVLVPGGGGGGSVTPGTTDNAVVRADGTSNDAIQGSLRIIDDEGQATFQADDAKFYPSYGSELLDSSGWTSTNWTGSFGAGFTHNTGNTSVLSNATAVTAGAVYRVTVTISGRTAGAITFGVGGVQQQSLFSTNTTRSEVIRASTTAGVTVTPQSTFDGTVTISLMQVSPSQPVESLLNEDSNVMYSIRALPGSARGIAFGNGSGQYISEGGISGLLSNTCIGPGAGEYLGSGYNNTLIGVGSGGKLSCGQANACIGSSAGGNLTSGLQNVFIGNAAGFAATVIGNAVFIGQSAGQNSTGQSGVAIGNTALRDATGTNNVGVGNQAGLSISSGGSNVFIGFNAGNNASQLATATNSTGIGNSVFTTASNQVVIGNTSVTETVLRGAVKTGTGAYNTLKVTSKTANYTIVDETFVAVDATSGGITITLPAAATASYIGTPVHIKKTDVSGNAVTIDGNGAETIDGATTQALASQYDSITIVSDGTAWHII